MMFWNRSTSYFLIVNTGLDHNLVENIEHIAMILVMLDIKTNLFETSQCLSLFNTNMISSCYTNKSWSFTTMKYELVVKRTVGLGQNILSIWIL